MKNKILLTLLCFSCSSLWAETAPNNNTSVKNTPKVAQVKSNNARSNVVDPKFAQVQQLLELKDYTAAHAALTELANQGNAQAIYNLGYLTQRGQGTVKNERKAVQLFQQSSNLGYGPASYVLSQYYSSGALGLKQDMNKAKDYLTKASKQGYDDATAQLGFLLFSEGKTEANKKALELLEPLVKKGHQQALLNVALYEMSVGQANNQPALTQKGVQTLHDLSVKGYVPALMALGNLLIGGDVLAQDLERAHIIFSELTKHNVPQAKMQLTKVEKMMSQAVPKTAVKQ